MTAIWGLQSCQIYKQDILFTDADELNTGLLQAQVQQAQASYQIQPNDWLEMELHTNKGERIIDANFELQVGNQNGQLQGNLRPRYLVKPDGTVKLPMLDNVALGGLSLYEAERKLQKLYEAVYKEPFVILRYANKRVTVLGAVQSQVVPLTNENTNLLEVLALAGGLTQDSRAWNIKLVRGDLNNPEVYVIDLSTVEGMKKSILPVLPGDVVYIEPVRRVVNEAIRDVAPVLSIISTTITLIFVIANL